MQVNELWQVIFRHIHLPERGGAWIVGLGVCSLPDTVCPTDGKFSYFYT
jgi:hypothetical protein